MSHRGSSEQGSQAGHGLFLGGALLFGLLLFLWAGSATGGGGRGGSGGAVRDSGLDLVARRFVAELPADRDEARVGLREQEVDAALRGVRGVHGEVERAADAFLEASR